jgi:hypothetical protein
MSPSIGPFTALVWKEWRQLRGIRWAGLLLAALIVVMCLIYGASGGAPLGLFGSPSDAVDVDGALELALWAVLILLWPLIAAMSAVQGFSADGAAPSASFVSERPVAPSVTWAARLLAVLASCALVALLAAALVLVAVAGLSTLPIATVLPGSDAHGAVWKLGAALLLLALGCALAATAFRLGGFAALLVSLGAAYGLVAALGLVVQLMYVERILGWPPAAWLGLVLVLAALVTSWVSSTRGEPAGRRQLLRAAVTLVAALVAGLILLVPAVSHAAHRQVFRKPGIHGNVLPSPDGRGTIVSTAGGLLVVQPTPDADGPPVAVRAVGGPAFHPVWEPGGSRFAVWSEAGPVGLRRWLPRLRVYDRQGNLLRAQEHGNDWGYWYLGVGWCGGHIVWLAHVDDAPHPVAIDPENLRQHPVHSDFEELPRTPLLSRAGRCWWARDMEAAEDPPALSEPRPIGLYPLSLQPAGRVAPEPDLTAIATPWAARQRLSPSGRYWLDAPGPQAPDRPSVRALSSDEAWPVPLSEDTAPLLEPTWIGKDLLTWIMPAAAEEHAAGIVVHAWRPGPDPAEAHPLALPGQGLRIQASPSDRWLLVSRKRTSSGEALIDRDTGAITHLDEPLPDRSAERLVPSSFWIDARTLGTLYVGGPLVVRSTDALDDPQIIPLP